MSSIMIHDISLRDFPTRVGIDNVMTLKRNTTNEYFYLVTDVSPNDKHLQVTFFSEHIPTYSIDVVKKILKDYNFGKKLINKLIQQYLSISKLQ